MSSRRGSPLLVEDGLEGEEENHPIMELVKVSAKGCGGSFKIEGLDPKKA